VFSLPEQNTATSELGYTHNTGASRRKVGNTVKIYILLNVSEMLGYIGISVPSPKIWEGTVARCSPSFRPCTLAC